MTPFDMARIHQLCFTKPRPWSEDEFSKLLKTPGSFVISADYGFLVARQAGPEAELLTIAVEPDHQGKAIGQNLIAQLFKAASDRNVSEIFLDVAKGNDAAIALYEKTGFEKLAERQNYYTGNITALIYKYSFR